MNNNETANKILDHLKEDSWFVDTYKILDAISFDRKQVRLLKRILTTLAVNGVIERRSKGKRFEWKIKVQEWDRYNPLTFKVAGATPIIIEKEGDDETKEAFDASYLEDMIAKLQETLLLQREKMEEQTKKILSLEQNQGASVKSIEVKIGKAPKIEVEGKPHPRLERVLKLASASLNILLIGPAGSGKTHLSEQVANCLKRTFAFVSCSAGMSEGHLLGRLLPTGDSGRFEYQRSEFVKAYEEGGVFLFDEVDAADPNTLLVLNTALANGHLAVPNRAEKPVATKHKDFICMAAANTFGTGADRQYVGRNQLDEAFLDRFRIGQVCLDYSKEVEVMVCPDQLLRDRFQAYRQNCNNAKIRRVISSRAMKDAYRALLAGLTDEEIDEALFGGWREDEVTKAKQGVRIVDRNLKPQEEAKSPKEEMLVGSYEQDAASMERPAPLPQGEQIPICPRHNRPMCRMGSGKGWRCSEPGNKYDARSRRWTVCNHCKWDHDNRITLPNPDNKVDQVLGRAIKVVPFSSKYHDCVEKTYTLPKGWLIVNIRKDDMTVIVAENAETRQRIQVVNGHLSYKGMSEIIDW